MKIRNFKKSDFTSVKSIYQQGIDTGNATFQKKAKGWSEWNSSFLITCRIVAELNNEVVGWAALSAASNRTVYSGVAEVSIYIAKNYANYGIGNSLLSELISTSENEGIWTLQAGIFPENESSIAIHSKNGFKIIGVREKLGKMNGAWRDILFMERRSKVVGI
ncbi:GNAT family N-acetyltransferase [Amylibacter sp.]|nr:GNAT family N-acetyltransferase [Amylibacter sp.]MDA9308428.1 GNAT family N-acetyltransferase [Amylibacter sp.]